MEEYVIINGFHSIQDLNLTLVKKVVSPPEVKENNISIPGSDGTINLLKGISGKTNYKSRKIRMDFAYIDLRTRWDSQYSKIADLFHGENCKVIFSRDSNYFYQGVAKITKGEREGKIGELTMELTADPYKYDVYATDERMPWDDIDFEESILQEVIEIPIGETKDREDGRLKSEIAIIGRKKKTAPVIIITQSGGEAVVRFKGKEYALKDGENKFLEMTLDDGKNKLTFLGFTNSSKITIRYRGGRL